MPVNPYACCETVRDLCKSHTKCCKVRHGGLFVTGTRLVEYCTLKGDLVLPSTCALPTGFDLEDQYPICKYMHKNITDFFSCARVLPEDLIVTDTGRKQGGKKIFFIQDKSSAKTPSKKRKNVSKTPPSNNEKNQEKTPGSMKKRSHKEKFFEDVLFGAQKYRRNYRELAQRQRVERVEQLAKDVLSACVNQKEAKDAGRTYLKDNKELQMDVLTFLGK